MSKKSVLTAAVLALVLTSALLPTVTAGHVGNVTDLRLASLRDQVGSTATGCYVTSEISVKNVGDVQVPYDITVTLASQNDPASALYTETVTESLPLSSGDQRSYTLWTSTWTVAPGRYVLAARVSTIGDENPRNDSRTTGVLCR